MMYSPFLRIIGISVWNQFLKQVKMEKILVYYRLREMLICKKIDSGWYFVDGKPHISLNDPISDLSVRDNLKE